MKFTLSDEEHALVVSAAVRERLAVGAYAAQAVLTAAQGSVQPQYAQLREALAAVMRAAGRVQQIGVSLGQAVAASRSGEPPSQLRLYAEEAAQAVRKLDDLADELRRRLP